MPSRTGWGGWTTQLAYSLVFFAVAFLLAQHPEKLSAVLGRFMGPLLLAFIAVLFIACLAHGAVTPTQPTGDYAVHQASRGFLDGYQTMDLLAALYFGIVISANVRAMHVTDNTLIRRETAYAGLGTGILLIVIYAVLGYVGVVSGSIASVNPATDTGATVLTNLTASLFGTFGMVFLGIVFVIRVSYRAWQALFTVFSFVVSNAGLSMIIKVSVPVLAALYPIAIVLVTLALTHRILAAHFSRVYFWMVLLVAIVSFATCLASIVTVFGGSLPWLEAILNMLPLQQFQLGWIIPALAGLLIGVLDSAAHSSFKR